MSVHHIEIRCQFIILEIRCQFIILTRKDELISRKKLEKARERRIVGSLKPIRWNPAGNQSRPGNPVSVHHSRGKSGVSSSFSRKSGVSSSFSRGKSGVSSSFSGKSGVSSSFSGKSGKSGVSSSFSREIRCQFIILTRGKSGREIRCQFIILVEIRCQFIILTRKDELISRQEARERRIVGSLKPFRWNPAGNQSRPVEPDQQPEASLAWWVGNHPCELRCQREIRCQFIILIEIRCRFIILTRKDELISRQEARERRIAEA